jgi:hypothetical protein
MYCFCDQSLCNLSNVIKCYNSCMWYSWLKTNYKIYSLVWKFLVTWLKLKYFIWELKKNNINLIWSSLNMKYCDEKKWNNKEKIG